MHKGVMAVLRRGVPSHPGESRRAVIDIRKDFTSARPFANFNEASLYLRD
jgi:hypothetical protein